MKHLMLAAALALGLLVTPAPAIADDGTTSPEIVKCVTAPCNPPFPARDCASRVTALNVLIVQDRQTIADLTTELAGAGSYIDELESRVASKDARITRQRATIARLRSKLEAHR